MTPEERQKIDDELNALPLSDLITLAVSDLEFQVATGKGHPNGCVYIGYPREDLDGACGMCLAGGSMSRRLEMNADAVSVGEISEWAKRLDCARRGVYYTAVARERYDEPVYNSYFKNEGGPHMASNVVYRAFAERLKGMGL